MLDILGVMAEIDKEGKEACIHCGKVWYSARYLDGVCHQCQRDGKPGRHELMARKKVFRIYLIIAVLFISILLASAFFG